MPKILTALVALMVMGSGSLVASPNADGDIDVSQPSFVNIVLRKPNIYADIPQNQKITIFAPSDEAFSKLSPEVKDNIFKPEYGKQLQTLMNAHVVRGNYPLEMLEDGMVLQSEEGSELKITRKGDKVFVNEAEVTEPDGIIRRGSMHTINRVLVPEDMTLKEMKQ